MEELPYTLIMYLMLKLRLFFQTEQMRDLERELEYMREESNNVQSIKDNLPNVCPKSSDRCLENDC